MTPRPRVSPLNPKAVLLTTRTAAPAGDVRRASLRVATPRAGTRSRPSSWPRCPSSTRVSRRLRRRRRATRDAEQGAQRARSRTARATGSTTSSPTSWSGAQASRRSTCDGGSPGSSSRSTTSMACSQATRPRDRVPPRSQDDGHPEAREQPGREAAGRAGSADTNKRVKELAFKSIDLKGEAARRLTMVGQAPTAGGAGGGDLSTWLHASRPRIYFFMAVRVLSDTRLRRRRPMGRDRGAGRRRCRALLLRADRRIAHDVPTAHGVPTAYELDESCTAPAPSSRALDSPPPPIPPM